MLKNIFIKLFPNSSGYSPRKTNIFSFLFVIIILTIVLGILLAVRDANSSETIETINFFGAIIIFTIIWFIVENYFGKKRHKSVLYSKKIIQLKTIYNFEIENLNQGNYWGYKGDYKNYFFRIYYDWAAGPKKSGVRFCIMLHYKPQMVSKDIIDWGKLNLLTESYNKGNPYYSEIQFNTSYLIIKMRYNFLTSFDEFTRKLDLAVKIAREENLMSNSERDVEKLLLDKELQILHAPEIDTLYE